VICHAGHGTIARALERGVPILAVPHSGDMAENAARLDWAGLGVRLPWRLTSPTTVRLAAERALSNQAALSVRARQLADWSAANDGPTRAAELIEEMLPTTTTAGRTPDRLKKLGRWDSNPQPFG
jgi:UDP:flavonoid glycosyltransferase YjiC (YdhE family)